MGIQPDYSEIEGVLKEITGESIKFETMVDRIGEGGSLFSLRSWVETFGTVLTEQLKSHGSTILTLCLLIISAAVLTTIAKAFRNRQISDMGYYMIYLLLFLIMMRSFGTCYSLTEQVVADLSDFMKALMPAYLMAAAVSAYRTSAVVYYEGFLLMIYYLQKLIFYVALPGVKTFVLLCMIGRLGSQDYFSRGREGLKKMILFLLKAMISVTAGLQLIQGMISPAIDEFKQTALSRGISSLGNLGNVAQNVTDVVLGSGMLLKNGIGAAAAVVIVTICLIPVAELSCYLLFYQMLSAAAESVSDQRFIGAIADMGEGIGLLVKVLFTVCAMFLLTIAVVCVTTGGVG